MDSMGLCADAEPFVIGALLAAYTVATMTRDRAFKVPGPEDDRKLVDELVTRIKDSAQHAEERIRCVVNSKTDA